MAGGESKGPPARSGNLKRGLLRAFQGAQGLNTPFPGARPLLTAPRRHWGLRAGSLEDRGRGAGGTMSRPGKRRGVTSDGVDTSNDAGASEGQWLECQGWCPCGDSGVPKELPICLPALAQPSRS